ncbi:MAG: hypothetical protein ACQEQ4_01525 [Fibrobacterota bacterium]
MGRAHAFILMLIFAVSLSRSSEVFFVRPVRSTGIYENRLREVNEQAITAVDENVRLKVTDSQQRYYYVVFEEKNIEGWVEQRNVARIEGRSYTFDTVTVPGYMNTPTVVSVQGHGAHHLTDPIDIDRNFEETMRQQVDKEQVIRYQY